MTRNWLFGAVTSAVLHGGAAAVLLASAAIPRGAPVPLTEPHTIAVDLIDARQLDTGAQSQSASQPEIANPSGASAEAGALQAAGTSVHASTAVPGAAPAAQATTPDPGAVSDYYRRVESHLARFHSYPDIAASPRPSGMVRIALIVRRDGRVMDAWIETSSGVVVLDEAALQTLRRAEPLPVLPATLPGAIDLIVPLRYAAGPRDAG